VETKEPEDINAVVPTQDAHAKKETNIYIYNSTREYAPVGQDDNKDQGKKDANKSR
jgi:hypothetical protein